jgi:hypothetical protein
VYGRIYRLFLYVADVLDGAFLYDPRITPDEEKESSIRDRYNQIWSLYVDSRMERLGIESFFDRALRRNLLSTSKAASDGPSGEDIRLPLVEGAVHLSRDRRPELSPGGEVSRAACIPGQPLHREGPRGLPARPSVAGHIERLDSPGAATVLNDLLSFTAYSCRDGLSPPPLRDRLPLSEQGPPEFIPSGGHAFVLSILDPRSGMYDTREIGEDADVEVIQKTIKDRYAMLAVSARGQFG